MKSVALDPSFYHPLNLMIFSRVNAPRRLISGFAIACSWMIFTVPLIQPQMVMAGPISSFLQSVKRVFSPKPPVRYPGGGRGPEAIVSPGVWVDRDATQKVPQVWSLQPVILYQAPSNTKEVPTALQLVDIEKPQEVIQSFEVYGKSYARLEVNKQLQPGKIYRVEQLQNKTNIKASVTFRVMGGALRNRLTLALDNLEKQGAATPQQLSEQKVKLFVQNQLWSDALQEMSQWVESDDDWHAFTAVTIDEWRKGDQVTLQP
jgi:hypothetical protein